MSIFSSAPEPLFRPWYLKEMEEGKYRTLRELTVAVPNPTNSVFPEDELVPELVACLIREVIRGGQGRMTGGVVGPKFYNSYYSQELGNCFAAQLGVWVEVDKSELTEEEFKLLESRA